MGLNLIKINNSIKAAVRKGKWKNPGAALYDNLLNSFYCKGDIPTDDKTLKDKIDAGEYYEWKNFIEEAYMVAPVKDIKNSPYGRTPFSRSGCKYPHHIIKGKELVVSIPGLKAAYMTARNQGVLINHTPENKRIVAHFNRHFRELGIEPIWHWSGLYFQDIKTKEFVEKFDFNGIDTVIFDIGSVLSEPKDGKELIKNEYHNKFNKTQLDCFVKSYYDKLDDYETASISNAKKLYKSFLTDDIKQYSDDVFEILALSGDAYDYTDSMIKELKDKGYKLYYLSNWHRSGFELMKQKGKFKYLDQFDGGLVSYDAGCQKPDPKIYQLLIDKFKLNPSACIFFDDREENIEAAKKIGFKAEQFHRGTVKEINRMNPDDIYKEKIQDNFNFIYHHIMEKTGLNLFNESDYFKVLKSDLDDNFKPNGSLLLSDFAMMKITKELTKKFANQGKLISYMRDDNPKYDDECLLWVDDDGNYVCSITYDKVPNKDDGHKWISGMDVAYAYSGYGLSHQLLDYAIAHGIDALSVQMDNEIALKTYKNHGFEISPESQEKVNKGLSSQYDMFLSTPSKNDSFEESAMSNEAIHLNSETQKEIGYTPEEIFKWMHENISYDNTITGWKLRTPSEVYVDKKGNCHDQALFEAFIFHSLGIPNGQLFFVEFSKDQQSGGNTHTLTWFRTAEKEANLSDDWKAPFKEENAAKGPFKFWWFENAWEDQAGIHGPYKSVEEIKTAILEVYNNDNDINSHKYDGIVFGKYSNYRCGMSLGEYVESWRLDDDRLFSKQEAIKEGFEWIENVINNNIFKENITITRLSDIIKNLKTPEDLLKWMNCIQYGWIDKKGKVNGTGDNDDTQHLFDEYRLQNPKDLIRNKVGVCWDQVEFERKWFDANNYPYAVIYVEVDDGENNPTHTFLIYKEAGENSEVYWFEHSWGVQKGIHKYKDLNTCLRDSVSKVIESFGTDGIKIVRKLNRPMPSKITCEEYYKRARSGFVVDLGDLQYDEIFNERAFSWIYPPSKEFMEKYANMNRLDMERQSWRREVLCEWTGATDKFIEGYDLTSLPDKLYFSAPIKVNKLRGRVFLSPYIGVSSIFIIDRFRVAKKHFADVLGGKVVSSSYNIGYDEWGLSDEDLMKPLSMVHMKHNIPDVKEVGRGQSSGYIHVVDVSKVKDKLELFKTRNANREVIYNGDEPLPVIEIIPHTTKWEIRFDEEEMKIHGPGSIIIKESTIAFQEADSQEENNDEPPELEADENKPVDENSPIDDEPPELATEDESQGEQKKEGDEGNEDSDNSGTNDQSDEVNNETIDKEEIKEEKPKKESLPKQTDRAESDKNGVRRKKLYIAFIEWSKEYNSRNTFGSIFDKDAFHDSYPFVPHEMRYFYRLANPMLCVLAGDLTFFQVAELRKLNSSNKKLDEMLIFAATPNDLRVFNIKDKKVYRAEELNGEIQLKEVLSDTFDTYIQMMIQKGDILNGPIETEEYKEE